MFSSNTTNALNLFPTTSGPSATQTKLARLLYDATANARGPTEIQNTLARSLFDDAVQYMNTLEMNRAASYTFGHRNSYGQNGTTSNELGGNTHGESIASEMWELAIDLILEKYTQHSVLALCKTISLVQHVLLHGSESIVTDGGLLYRLQMAVGPLRQLNTALVEQQMVEQILNKNDNGSGRIENDVVLTAEGIGQQIAQFGTRATATMVKLRGGSVDQGHPVRVAASNLFGMASNPTYLKQLRMQQAGNNNQFGASSSLVPIGSTKQVGYITDDARLQLLEQKMAQEEQELKRKQWEEQQKLKQTRSNLAGKSATDSFGGGYAANGGGSGIVVGAAHSLEDMIKTAKYELEQHKAQKRREVASIKKGYCDDPGARARQLQELEGNNNNDDDVEMDPKFLEKEKALNDALEYLEEMQQVEREKVDNLLEEDFLGNGGGGGGNSNVGNPSGDVFGGGNAGYGADLLGFDNNPSTSTAPPTMDVFGGASPSMPMTSSMGGGGGGGSMDLLGFSAGPYAQQAVPSGPAPGGNIMGGAVNNIMSAPSSGPTPGGNIMGGAGNDIMSAPSNMNNNAAGMGGDFMGASNGFDLRPSLVTGMGMGAMNPPGSGPATSQQPFRDAPVSSVQPSNPVVNEEAEAENSRKMQMAAGLFAGVNSNQMPATQGRKPIMQMNSTSSISALDDLIPALEAPAPPPMMSSMGNNSVFDGASNELNPSPPIPSSDPFEMGGGGIMGIGGNSGGDNDFSSRDMGPPPPPPMAPPPPPVEPPPPLPPTMAPMPPAPSAMMAAMPTMAPSPGAMNNNNMMGGNQSVEQMQAMIQQQQAQMNQMMQMMQQMQMQGGSNNPNNGGGAGGGMGGWPPPS